MGDANEALRTDAISECRGLFEQRLPRFEGALEDFEVHVPGKLGHSDPLPGEYTRRALSNVILACPNSEW
jgi:hypothetical protein